MMSNLRSPRKKIQSLSFPTSFVLSWRSGFLAWREREGEILTLLAPLDRGSGLGRRRRRGAVRF